MMFGHDALAARIVAGRGGQPRQKSRLLNHIASPKDHVDLGGALGLMDFEAASKMSGARFVVLKGQLARLERALGQLMLDVQTQEHGYTEVSPPLLVRDEAATNFDSRNDRNASAVVAPTISAGGAAVDHSIRDDGGADISLEWSWAGTEADIDGFIVYLRSSASGAVYTNQALRTSGSIFDSSSRIRIRWESKAHERSPGLTTMHFPSCS